MIGQQSGKSKYTFCRCHTPCNVVAFDGGLWKGQLKWHGLRLVLKLRATLNMWSITLTYCNDTSVLLSIIDYQNMFFFRFLTNQWYFLIFNDSGWNPFTFGRFEYFFISFLPVVWELLRKNQNGNTSTCCTITAFYLCNTTNIVTIFFTIMRGYFNILKWYNHITSFLLLII